MTKEELSTNEKLVLYAVVKYPGHNDRMISERTDLKMSTVTAIKNRLKRREFFQTVIVPNMPMLGCEIATVVWTTLDPSETFEKKFKEMKRIVDRHKSCVWAVMDPRNFVALMLFKNYTELYKVGAEEKSMMATQGLIDPTHVSMSNYPFLESGIYRYFDHSHFLKNLFGIDMDEGEQPPFDVIGYQAPKCVDLTSIERKVLLGLLKFPELLDSNISEKIGVTRQSVTKIRRKLESIGLIRTLKIPNLKKLDFEILVGSHVEYSREFCRLPSDQRMKAFQSYPISRFLFTIMSNTEAFLFSVFKDFRSLQIGSADSHGFFKKTRAFRSLPTQHLLSIEEMKVLKNHEYAPLVEENLPEAK